MSLFPSFPACFATLDAIEVTRLLLALGVLLASARILGDIARRFRQPAVLGEILAGILLGPALLGRVAPDVDHYLFPAQGPTFVLLDGVSTLSACLFLLVAGLEIDLSRVAKQGRRASMVAVFGLGVPFAVGLLAAWLAPQLIGFEGDGSRTLFRLFFATALSISALPVIAKTLMDLQLYDSDFGMIVIASAMFDDIVGWMIFAILLGMMGAAGESGGVGVVAALTLGYTLAVLTIGRWLFHRLLPWIRRNASWPQGVIVFAISLALLSGALTSWIGIHAIFGAFLVGVALGNSSHLDESTRTTIREFVSSFFAPLFFAMIGLRVDFAAHFDVQLAAIVIAIACVAKIGGCSLGARLAGMPPKESLAIGFAMNARGAIGILLGSTALHSGLIGERMFVALVTMALVTSMMSGPLIQRALGRRAQAETLG